MPWSSFGTEPRASQRAPSHADYAARVAGRLVERFFAEITTKRVRRGSYSSVYDLEQTIYDYLLHHNANPKPFVWRKNADDIIARERRALTALDDIRGNR